MVIDDLDIKYVAILELETDTPLVVNPDTVLPLAITTQGFQPVARRCSQEVQRGGGIQLRQLAFGHLLNCAEAAWIAAFEQRPGFLAGKRLDHNAQDITFSVICQQ